MVKQICLLELMNNRHSILILTIERCSIYIPATLTIRKSKKDVIPLNLYQDKSYIKQRWDLQVLFSRSCRTPAYSPPTIQQNSDFHQNLSIQILDTFRDSLNTIEYVLVKNMSRKPQIPLGLTLPTRQFGYTPKRVALQLNGN